MVSWNIDVWQCGVHTQVQFEVTATETITNDHYSVSCLEGVSTIGTEAVVTKVRHTDFRATPTSGVAPLKVSFTNLSVGDYETCLWTFGDGSSSSDCNDLSHTYINSGVYTVTLMVHGPGGTGIETKAEYINIYEMTRADFIATPTRLLP